jgi:predicted RNA methylase
MLFPADETHYAPVLPSPVAPPAPIRREPPAAHLAAMRSPAPGFEAAIVRLYGGMADYAEAHSKRYECALVTDDYFIGEAWERLGNALHDLLNGETGRLDCATLSGAIYKLIEGGGSQSAIAAVREQTAPPKLEKVSQTIGIGRAALSDRQRELLAHVRVENNFAVYTSNDRIPDWPLLKSIMVALGGTWKTGGRGKPGGFRFPDDIDAAESVRLAQESGEIIDPKAAEFFATPPELAELVARRAELMFNDSVLEPSAGRGALALAARDYQKEARIVCVEALAENVKELVGRGFDVTQDDFLTLSPEQLGTYSRVVMNPPFSKRQDIKHVRHAFRFLAPGGVLVAIMSSGVQFRDDKLSTEFRAWVAVNNGDIWSNPPGSFLASGTGVNTCMVRLRKATE